MSDDEALNTPLSSSTATGNDRLTDSEDGGAHGFGHWGTESNILFHQIRDKANCLL